MDRLENTTLPNVLYQNYVRTSSEMTGGTMSLTIPTLKNMEEGLVSLKQN